MLRKERYYIAYEWLYERKWDIMVSQNEAVLLQMLMTKILGPINWKKALCFIDDIIDQFTVIMI